MHGFLKCGVLKACFIVCLLLAYLGIGGDTCTSGFNFLILMNHARFDMLEL